MGIEPLCAILGGGPWTRNFEIAPVVRRDQFGVVSCGLPAPQTINADVLARRCRFPMRFREIPDCRHARRKLCVSRLTECTVHQDEGVPDTLRFQAPVPQYLLLLDPMMLLEVRLPSSVERLSVGVYQ